MPLSPLQRFSRLNILIFVAISVLLSGMLASLVSILLRGKITGDYLIAGGVVSFIVSGIVIFLMHEVLRFNEDKENLHMERLAESEEQFRFLYEKSPIGIAFADANGFIADCNDKFTEISGAPRKKLIGFNIITGVTDEKVKSAVNKAFSGTQTAFEGDYVTAAGSRRIVMRTIYSPLFTNSGSFRGIMLLTEDITERKRAEKALKETEEKFRLFLEYCPVYVFFKDENIKSLHLSRNFEELLGRPVQELLGRTMDEFFPAAVAKRMVEDDLRILREGKPLEVEEEFNGRIYSTQKFPILIEGKPRFLAGFTTDITERKLAEEKLRESEERYALVLAGAGDGIWDWDVPKKRVFFSTRWKAMRGYSDEEVGDREEEWSGNIHPEDASRVFASVQNHFEGKTPWFSEDYRVRCKDGTWMWVHDRGLALQDSEGRVIRMAGSETDITGRKQMEAERERLIADLKEALAKVKTLSGLLPICSFCKKIRDDRGYWNQLELFVRNHSEAEFSHGICPDCARKFYPEFYGEGEDGDNGE